eukprot:scaffold43386_cov35-Cyclotella_meneghiniana.AAC.2
MPRVRVFWLAGYLPDSCGDTRARTWSARHTRVPTRGVKLFGATAYFLQDASQEDKDAAKLPLT